jgi:3-deoxy-D-manno-octulosonate 8-phosphate phosphatase (KDO 8-P phosphatase)
MSAPAATLEGARREALERARRVRLMVFDVDGVLTDGTLWYDASGEVLKAFHVGDGSGIRMLIESGVQVALLSGRRSAAVATRAAELGIRDVLQGIDEKRPAFEELLARLGLPAEQAGYMGDDVIDLPVLARCGFACAPSEAARWVQSRVHYVTAAQAGRGAVREVCELIMQAQETLEPALRAFLR